MTVPGPFTMSEQAQNEHYPNEEALAMAYAVAVNEEIRDLFSAGADIVQVDEPYMQAHPERARATLRSASCRRWSRRRRCFAPNTARLERWSKVGARPAALRR